MHTGDADAFGKNLFCCFQQHVDGVCVERVQFLTQGVSIRFERFNKVLKRIGGNLNSESEINDSHSLQSSECSHWKVIADTVPPDAFLSAKL